MLWLALGHIKTPVSVALQWLKRNGLAARTNNCRPGKKAKASAAEKAPAHWERVAVLIAFGIKYPAT